MTQLETPPAAHQHDPHLPHALPGPLERPKGDVLRSNWSYEFARAINTTWFRLFHGIRYRAVQNLPLHGPIIIAPNHVSFYDPPCIAAGIPFRIRFMAWEALFRVPILRGILNGYGAYPVKLKSADKGAISQTLRLLRNGEAVMIFPEGIRGDEGQLKAFEQGISRIAIQTEAAIVPVTITGAFEAWPSANMLPRLFRPIIVKFHTPVYPSDVPPDLDLKTRVAELNKLIAIPIARRLRAWHKCRD